MITLVKFNEICGSLHKNNESPMIEMVCQSQCVCVCVACGLWNRYNRIFIFDLLRSHLVAGCRCFTLAVCVDCFFSLCHPCCTRPFLMLVWYSASSFISILFTKSMRSQCLHSTHTVYTISNSRKRSA